MGVITAPEIGSPAASDARHSSRAAARRPSTAVRQLPVLEGWQWVALLSPVFVALLFAILPIMSIGKRLVDLARSNLTDFRSAFDRDHLRDLLRSRREAEDEEPESKPGEAGSEAQAQGESVLLVNAGGVIVSYFEWVQNIQEFRWTLDRVNDELKRFITEAFQQTRVTASEERLDLRIAAYMIGISRVMQATRLRGYV